MMDDGSDVGEQVTEIEDAWVFLEETEIENYAQWSELLQVDRHRKGLQRITIDSFGGRAGWRELAEMRCVNEKGEPVGTTQFAKLDANKVARRAFQACQKDHKRNAREMYRMQLWVKLKRNSAEEQGERVTLKWSESGVEEYGGARNPNEILSAQLVKSLCGHMNDNRRQIDSLLNAQVQIAQASAGTAALGIQQIHAAGELQARANELASQVNRGATSEDINRRIDTVFSRLEGPLQIIAKAVAPGMRQWAQNLGNDAPRGNGHAGNGRAGNGRAGNGHAGGNGHTDPATDREAQAKAQTFFDGLSGKQTDALRDAMGQDQFNACAEVIHGDADQWTDEGPHLKQILLDHAGALREILSADQFGVLLDLA